MNHVQFNCDQSAHRLAQIIKSRHVMFNANFTSIYSKW